MSNAFNGDLVVIQTMNGSNMSGGQWEMLPTYRPTAVTDITQISIHVTDISFTNVTAAPVTLSVWDRQSLPTGGNASTPTGQRRGTPTVSPTVNPGTAPMAWFMNYPIPPNQTIVFSLNGRLMQGGVTVQCASANAVVLWLRGYGPNH